MLYIFDYGARDLCLEHHQEEHVCSSARNDVAGKEDGDYWNCNILHRAIVLHKHIHSTSVIFVEEKK